MLKSVTGEVMTYRGADLTRPHWLLAQRVVPLAGGLQRKDLYYSVQRADVLKSNVVNASQQRFEPSNDRTLTFRLSFYPLRLQAKDALFGRPAGTIAKVEFPDGHVERVALEHGVIQLHSLPRGTYNVTVAGGRFVPHAGGGVEAAECRVPGRHLPRCLGRRRHARVSGRGAAADRAPVARDGARGRRPAAARAGVEVAARFRSSREEST